LKKGKSRTFHGLDPEISTVIAVCLGKKGTGYNDLEGLDEGRDQIRNAVARWFSSIKMICIYIKQTLHFDVYKVNGFTLFQHCFCLSIVNKFDTSFLVWQFISLKINLLFSWYSWKIAELYDNIHHYLFRFLQTLCSHNPIL
jgi:hypothetical protein